MKLFNNVYDRLIFFIHILYPSKPNKALREAQENYIKNKDKITSYKVNIKDN